MLSKKSILIIVFIVVVVGLGTGGLACVYSKTKEFDQVFRNEVYVEETYIGGLTREAAKLQVVEMIEKKEEAREFILDGSDQEWMIPYTRFQGEYNIDEVLEQAFQVGHEGNMIQRFRAFTRKEVEKVAFTLDHSYRKEISEEIIQEYADEFYIAPQDATMTRESKKFIITPERPGQELDVKATAKRLDAIYSGAKEGKVEAVIAVIEAKKTASYFNNVQSPVASFYTTYTNTSPSRNTNLAVGAKTINTSIEPGETFALSNYLGDISAENGYKTSKVIVNGKLVDGIGGGICQVASTLYNSVLLTDLKVVSRRNHSLPVGYIPLGRDATYATGAIDFKFENPTEYPAYVESYMENNRLYVNIFGHESLKPDHDIKFESVVVEVIPAPAPKYEKDPTLPKGKEVSQLSPLDGKKVNLYKYTYKDGKLVDKVLENQSYYRPRAAIISVGTKEVLEVPEVPVVPVPMPPESKPVEDNTLEVIEDPSVMDLYEEQA